MKQKLLFFIVILFTVAFNSNAQDTVGNQGCPPIADICFDPVVKIPDSISICPSSTKSITINDSLPTGYTALDYHWSPSTGVFPSSGPGDPNLTNATITAPSSCTNYLLYVDCLGPNLIQDGDFASWPACTIYPCMESLYGNGCYATGGGAGNIKIGGSHSDQETDCPNFDSHTGGGESLLVHGNNVRCPCTDNLI